VRTQLNTITVSLFANVELSTCAHSWLPSSPAWNPAAAELLDNSAVTRLIQTGVTFPYNLDLDLGEVHRVESVSIIGYDGGDGVEVYRVESASIIGYNARDGVKDVEIYFWNDAVVPAAFSRVGALVVGQPRAGQPSTLGDGACGNHQMVLYQTQFSAVGLAFFGCKNAQTTVIRISNLPTPTSASDTLTITGVDTPYGQIGRPVRNADGSTTGFSGVFRDGALEVEIYRAIKAFDFVGISFVLRNAPAPQPPATVGVAIVAKQIPRTNATGAVLSSLDIPQIIPRTNATGTVLSSLAIPKIIAAGSTISETSTLQSDINTITMTVQVNVPLEAGQDIEFRMEAAFG
ncbi:hypothetical protein T484DRAFT_1828995, partial [Baffinella frigidus]